MSKWLSANPNGRAPMQLPRILEAVDGNLLQLGTQVDGLPAVRAFRAARPPVSIALRSVAYVKTGSARRQLSGRQ